MDKHPTRQAPSNPRLILTQDAAQRLKRDGQVAGAVMNHAFSVERRYQKELAALTDLMTKEMKKAIVAELQVALAKAKAELPNETNETATGQDAADDPTGKPTAASGTGVMTAIEKVHQRFKKMFASLSTGLSTNMVGQASQASKASVSTSLKDLVGRHTIGMKFMDNPAAASAIKGAIKENIALISSFPDEYAARLKRTMKTTLLHGGNLHSFKKSVDRIIDRTDKDSGVIKRKVMNIATDQARKAYSAMNETRLTAAGVKKFEWIHSGGGATARPFHLHQWPTGLNGGIFEFANPPVIDPDTGERGMPAQLPYCKCTFRPVVEFDESGDFTEEEMANVLGEAPRAAPKETPISPPLTPLPRDFYGAGTNRLSPASPAFNPRDYFGRPEPAPRVDTTTPPLRPVGFSRTPPRKPPAIKGGSAPTNVPRVQPKPRKPKAAKPTKIPKPRKPPAIPKPKVTPQPRTPPPVTPRAPAKPPVKPIDNNARLKALAAANEAEKARIAAIQAKNAELAKRLEAERRRLAELEAKKAAGIQSHESYIERKTVDDIQNDLQEAKLARHVWLNPKLPVKDLNDLNKAMLEVNARFETVPLASFADASVAEDKLKKLNFAFTDKRLKKVASPRTVEEVAAHLALGNKGVLSRKANGLYSRQRYSRFEEELKESEVRRINAHSIQVGELFDKRVKKIGFAGVDAEHKRLTTKPLNPARIKGAAKDVAEKMNWQNSWSASHSAKGTAIHEYGHHWHLTLNGTDKLNLDHYVQEGRKEGWDHLVSQYAAEDHDEYVAEAFALYAQHPEGSFEHERIYPPVLEMFKKHDRGRK